MAEIHECLVLAEVWLLGLREPATSASSDPRRGATAFGHPGDWWCVSSPRLVAIGHCVCSTCVYMDGQGLAFRRHHVKMRYPVGNVSQRHWI